MQKALVVLPYCPGPLRPRMTFFLNTLASEFVVDVIVPEVCAGDLSKNSMIDKTFFLKEENKLTRLIRSIIYIFRGIPITYSYYYNANLPKVLDSIDHTEYTFMYTKRTPIEAFEKFSIPIMFDGVDCFSYQTRLFRKNAKGLKKIFYALDSFILPRYEKKLINLSSMFWVTTPLEKERIASMVTRKASLLNKVVPIAHAVNISSIAKSIVPSLINTAKMPFQASFHGKLTYQQNVLALKNLNELAESLKSKGCDYEFSVFGKYPKNYPKEYPFIDFRGFVDSLEDAYSNTDLAVFPIVDCVGIQNKVLEVLAMRKPLLITPEIAATLPRRGLDQILEKSLFVREVKEFEEFLNSYTLVENNLAVDCSYDYYEQNFSNKILTEKLMFVLKAQEKMYE